MTAVAARENLVGRRVTVLSPHFDDVPLSLGQSLLDGALAEARVEVRVVFGRTNWTRLVHPTRERATPVGWWRRIEESVAARSFGYRWQAAGWEEVVLRWGTLDTSRLLDPALDLDRDPLVEEVADWIGAALDAEPDVLLAPAGIGSHVDHRIVALAATRARRHRTGTAHLSAVGFYEDRPYAAHVDASELERQLPPTPEPLVPVELSGPVRRSTQRRVRRCYPSQIDDYFERAMERDVAVGATERAWFVSSTVPPWLVAPAPPRLRP